MANIIASRAPLVVHLLKRQLLCMSPAPSLTPEVFEELHEKRKQTWCSNDMEEGVRAFFAKRPPCFRGNWGGTMTSTYLIVDLESAKWRVGLSKFESLSTFGRLKMFLVSRFERRFGKRISWRKVKNTFCAWFVFLAWFISKMWRL